MTDANQDKEDEVLRRMLATKQTPHKGNGCRNPKPSERPTLG